jgi:hypothetical protein
MIWTAQKTKKLEMDTQQGGRISLKKLGETQGQQSDITQWRGVTRDDVDKWRYSSNILQSRYEIEVSGQLHALAALIISGFFNFGFIFFKEQHLTSTTR